jgi:hypothetical protein
LILLLWNADKDDLRYYLVFLFCSKLSLFSKNVEYFFFICQKRLILAQLAAVDCLACDFNRKLMTLKVAYHCRSSSLDLSLGTNSGYFDFYCTCDGLFP